MALTESTKNQALNEGKSLLQIFGYNGFSFQHIADALGLRKQSVYGHFKSKEVLGEDLIESYRANFISWVEAVSVFGPEEKLTAWFDRFYRLLSENLKYCPLAAFASDYNSLPKSIQKKLKQFYEMRTKWVNDVIQEGQRKKVFRSDIKVERLTRMVVASAFGSQQIARLTNDPESIREAASDLMEFIKNVR